MKKFNTTRIAQAAQEATGGDAGRPDQPGRPARARRPNAKSQTCFTFTEKNVIGLAGPGPRDKRRSIEYTDGAPTPGLKIEVGRSGRGTFWYRYTFRGAKRAQRLGTVGAMTLGEARRITLEGRANLDRGIDPQEARDKSKAMPKFGEFALGPYLEWAKDAKRSHDDDRSRLVNHLVPRWGEWRLCDLTRRDIDMLIIDVRKKLAAGTVNRLIALTSAIYRQAMHWDVVDRNPCTGVKMLRESGGNENYLSDDELGRYLDALAAEPNKVAAGALELMARLGCRREEILQLRWEHVDLVRGSIKLVATKNGRARHQPLPQACIDLLTAAKAQARGPFVFPGRDSPDRPIRNVLKAQNRAVQRAQIGRHVRIHDLRHSVGASMVQAGYSTAVIAETLGHSDERVTRRYSHLNDATVRNGLEAMAERVARAQATPKSEQPQPQPQAEPQPPHDEDDDTPKTA